MNHSQHKETNSDLCRGCSSTLRFADRGSQTLSSEMSPEAQRGRDLLGSPGAKCTDVGHHGSRTQQQKTLLISSEHLVGGHWGTRRAEQPQVMELCSTPSLHPMCCSLVEFKCEQHPKLNVRWVVCIQGAVFIHGEDLRPGWHRTELKCRGGAWSKQPREQAFLFRDRIRNLTGFLQEHRIEYDWIKAMHFNLIRWIFSCC